MRVWQNEWAVTGGQGVSGSGSESNGEAEVAGVYEGTEQGMVGVEMSEHFISSMKVRMWMRPLVRVIAETDRIKALIPFKFKQTFFK